MSLAEMEENMAKDEAKDSEPDASQAAQQDTSKQGDTTKETSEAAEDKQEKLPKETADEMPPMATNGLPAKDEENPTEDKETQGLPVRVDTEGLPVRVDTEGETPNIEEYDQAAFVLKAQLELEKQAVEELLQDVEGMSDEKKKVAMKVLVKKLEEQTNKVVDEIKKLQREEAKLARIADKLRALGGLPLEQKEREQEKLAGYAVETDVVVVDTGKARLIRPSGLLVYLILCCIFMAIFGIGIACVVVTHQLRA